ncbi:hypothetical protein H1R81_08740 [Emticicia sp. BO119]|nr:hypothetical protein [Emticicia sp. BO119]
MINKTPYIEQLKKFYFEKYRKVLSEELAHEYFEQIVTLIECIYRPIPTELDKVEKVIT